jgi:Gas vesicle protein K
VTRRIRLDAGPEPAEKDLTALALTIAELSRQPMERRVEDGSLTEEQIEKTGKTLMALEDRMAELREHSGLRPGDLKPGSGSARPVAALRITDCLLVVHAGVARWRPGTCRVPERHCAAGRRLGEGSQAAPAGLLLTASAQMSSYCGCPGQVWARCWHN